MSGGFTLIFGWWADGHKWPETPGSKAACVGEAVIGPAGLLDILETSLGLGGPTAAQVRRIAAWQARMRECDDGNRSWSRSFKADSWSTARLLLGWRDELIEAGWTPATNGSPRLAEIALIENHVMVVPPGASDRLRQVIRVLKDGASVPISSLELVDELDALPIGWRELVHALSERGVKVSQVPKFSENATGDLRFLQGHNGSAGPMAGDGSVNVLFANTELTAAECLADWLASTDGQAGSTVIVAGHATELLDSNLADRGLPRVGLTDRSAFRGALQMLSLAFANSWQPFDPRPLLDLLLLPRPPVPRRVAREFAEMLRERPGLGHDGWREVWEYAAKWLADQEKSEDGDKGDKDEARLAEWRSWIEPQKFSAEPGMPIEAVVSICSRVQQWAYSRDRGAGDPLLTKVAQSAGELADAVTSAGPPVLSRSLLERMIDQVISDGIECPIAIPEACEWTVVSHPGAVWGNADRVIWWGFVDPTELPKPGPWTVQERELLKAAGCPLDVQAVVLERHSAAWRRAIMSAQKQVLFVRPGGTKTTVHPIWHEFLPKLENAGVSVICSAEDILEKENPHMAMRTLSRAAITAQPPPQTRRLWNAPGPIKALPSTSPTQIEDALCCPLRWTLANVLKIRPGSLQRMASEEQLLGNLAHEIARTVFVKGPPPAKDAARDAAIKLFAELVPRIAAPLALPGYAALHAEARQQIPHAIGELAHQLGQSGLIVEGCEVEKTGAMPDGTVIVGRLDLLTTDKSNKPVVLDLKWARRERRYREKLASGEAIQLAAYGDLVKVGGTPSAAGYFLIRHAGLLGSTEGPFPATSKVDGPDMASTWQSVVDAWQSRQMAIQAGRIVAPGVALADGAVDADTAPTLSPKPPCHYCEYRGVCGGSPVEA